MMNPLSASSRLTFTLLALLWLVSGACPSAVASPTPKSGDDWVSVPASFLASRLVRSAGGPATVYRVVLDVPAGGSPRNTRPRVTQSCGDEAVDGIAYDYVKAVLASNRSVAEQNRGKELRFQLRLTPTRVDTSRLALPANLVQTPTQGFWTPIPSYPAEARRGRAGGMGQVRARFPAGGGAPTLVVLTESTGNQVLNAHTVQWVLMTWRTGKDVPAGDHATTFAYALH